MPDDEVADEEPDMAGDEGSEKGRDLDNRLLVEGLLFSSGKPMRIVDIEEATTLPRGAVRSALRRLASDYRRRMTALEVVKVGDRWTMQVNTEYTKPVRAVATAEVPSRLLRTLALIAYHQPVRQSDLQEMLGPKVYDHVRELVGLGLVNAARKGSTKELSTTRKFPEYFGIASAKKEDIKRFLAERVGIKPPEPAPVEDGPSPEGDGDGGDDNEDTDSPEDATAPVDPTLTSPEGEATDPGVVPSPPGDE